MRFGIVADDNTGATDAAGMLTERGVRTLLVLDAARADLTAQAAGFDAVVVGTQNRSVAPPTAAQATRKAIDLLTSWGVDRFQIKYCSTFDSTPEGNIGPTLDAAADTLGAEATIVCPALPVNGRTVYQGHLFVGEQLLSESPLRDHPLNPMTDANLVRWLGRQTERRVGLVDLATVRRGAEAVHRAIRERAAEGCSYVVTDATEDADLLAIAEATAGRPLSSGGSGITAALAEVFYPGREPLDFSDRLGKLGGETLVVSGSQSPMTRRQREHALAHDWAGIRLDAAGVVRGDCDLDVIEADARDRLIAGQPVLLYSPQEGDGAVAAVQVLGRSLGLGEVETGARISDALAELAARLVRDGRVSRLGVSGGETSGALCRRLGLPSLEVGLPIAPGVPYCFSREDNAGGREMLVVLKSGNFGQEDLYERIRTL